MPDRSFLDFPFVPGRARYDGWTPALQLRFVASLARGAGPGEAAGRLGMSRQSAYKLRRRPGAEGFAAAWDSALLHARRVREAPPRPASPARRAQAVPAPPRSERRPGAVPAAGPMRDAFEKMWASFRAEASSQAGKGDKGDKGDGNPG
ncbi:MAG TPA: hypothetical protein VF759_15210 [Allosphingosinicella sp.]|jgi:hypothetical protein